MTERTVAVLSDDLIWASRLTAAIERAGARALRPATPTALGEAEAAIVDLNSRRFDPLEAVAAAHAADLRVMCVGPHEDVALRKLALSAGASRVYSYNKLFTDGPAVIARWLAG